jgi:predicted ester cyclase
MKRFVTVLCGALLAMGACRRDRTGGKTMPSQPGIAHVRKLIANFFNAHDPSVARDYFAAEQWSVEDWAAVLRDLGVATPPHAQNGGDALARGLIRIGEEAIERENDSAHDAYFSESYVLHGPLGDMTREELKRYFASLRSAFSNFHIKRERILTDGRWLAARSTMSGTFDHVFRMSPIGPVQPNGRDVRFEVINLFRYDDEGRLAEEWVQVDNLGLLRQLGGRVP